MGTTVLVCPCGSRLKATGLAPGTSTIEPNDVDAIAVQGEAMVELGATARAQANLRKLQTICSKGCPQLTQLSSAISRGPSVAAVKAPPSPKTN